MCGAATAVLLSATGAAHAQDEPAFQIPAQPLVSALYEFGEQSGRQVLFKPGLTDNKLSTAVAKAADQEQALAMLLKGTGLSFRRSGDVYLIEEEGGSAPQSGSAAGGGAEVEALIVTAQKREEDIQDVPIAISAFTQEDLTRSQVAGGPDLITQVPNMTFTKTNFSSYSVQLRGIGTQAISATTDPAVAVAFNNTPFIRNRFFEQEFYDLQRVEVLRGPQGTLYGRNATAGVVNIISQKPKFIAEAKLSGDVSNFNSSRLEGMVNIPIAEDAVALRIAGAWTKRDGYATNELTGNPIDGRDLWSTRVSLRVAPNDRFDANLIWEHFEEEDDRLRSGKQLCKKHVITEVGGIATPNYFQTLPDSGQSGIASGVQATFSQGCERESLYSAESFQTPNGLMLPYYLPLSLIGLPTARVAPYVSEVQSADLRVIESTIDPKYRANSDLGELQVSFDLGRNLSLSSETAYAVDTVYSMQDFNRFNTAPGAWNQPGGSVREGVLQPGPNGGIFCDPQLGCSDRLIAVDISTAEAWQFSQEFRLASEFEGPFNFSLGANYLRADSEDKYYVFINSLSLSAASSLFSNYSGPYVAGITDNIECLIDGYAPGDPGAVYSVTGCIYTDPNPVESVNDLGHNYFLSKNPYKLISYAVFGEAYYNVTDALKVTAGLRWTVDKKEAPRVPTWLLASNSVGYPVAEVIEQEWREPTGRLTVDWKPALSFTDETLIYGSYAHGYKAGGANPPGFVRVFYSDPAVTQQASDISATRPKTFEEEYVDAFEIGSKNTLLDAAMTLNLAAFYYDYKNYQISEIVDRSAFNRNFDVKIWGLEVEADWRPLDNLRLGVKGGYQSTRIADGERAVDLMDRAAGREDWVVVRPFPTYASSCVLPVNVFNYLGTLRNPGGVSGGNPSACEEAYLLGLDPVTNLRYVADPQVYDAGGGNIQPFTGDYAGFNPFDTSQGHNFGEGFYKELGGNELPNAPNWTATITADYTIPLPNEWLATLHTDLHWQAESWWRVFNDHEYGKLDEYFTMNLAAIFTNEERGWNVMAYIKNVTDETAITGAFLNSDDTGLTTNVFLTEPRLYGLRVTKAWTGGPLLGSLGERHDGPYPFTVELGGQVQRHDAPRVAMAPDFTSEFSPDLRIAESQNDDLDWGDGRDVRVIYAPGGRWSVSAGARFGKTNAVEKMRVTEVGDVGCAVSSDVCTDPAKYHFIFTRGNYADQAVTNREEYRLIDFEVGRDVGLGALGAGKLSAGIRHAQLSSTSHVKFSGVPNWEIPDEFALFKYSAHDLHTADLAAVSEFEGFGPTVTWEAAAPLLESNRAGRLSIDWAAKGGVLFGKQTATREGQEGFAYFTGVPYYSSASIIEQVGPTVVTPVNLARSESVSAPFLDLSLGMAYQIGGVKVGAGYRWERYFDAIDGGYAERSAKDRTIDGPYFKISVGFGG